MATILGVIGGMLAIFSLFLNLGEFGSMVSVRYPGIAYAFLLPVLGIVSIVFSFLAFTIRSASLECSRITFGAVIIAVALLADFQSSAGLSSPSFWSAFVGGVLVASSGLAPQMTTVKNEKENMGLDM